MATEPIEPRLDATALDQSTEQSTAALYRAVVGPVSESHYLPRFLRFDEKDRAGIQWNTAAALNTVNWFIFRQLWLPALTYVGSVIGLTLLVLGIGRLVFQFSEMVEMTLLAVLAALSFVLPGLFGTALFYKDCRKKMAAALAANATVPEACAALVKQASTRLRMLVIAAINAALIGLIALTYFNAPKPGKLLDEMHASAVAGGKLTTGIDATAPAASSPASATTAASAPASAVSMPASAASAPGVPSTPSSAPMQASSAPVANPTLPTASAPALASSRAVAGVVQAEAKPKATEPKPAASAASPPGIKASAPAPIAPPPALPASAVKPAIPASAATKAKPAAAPASAPKAASSAVKPPASAPVKPSTAAATNAAPAIAAGYYINVGLFAEEANAKKAHTKLLDAGLNAFVQELNFPKGKRIRVRVGPFDTEVQADAAATKIRGLQLDAVVFQQ